MFIRFRIALETLIWATSWQFFSNSNDSWCFRFSSSRDSNCNSELESLTNWKFQIDFFPKVAYSNFIPIDLSKFINDWREKIGERKEGAGVSQVNREDDSRKTVGEGQVVLAKKERGRSHCPQGPWPLQSRWTLAKAWFDSLRSSLGNRR